MFELYKEADLNSLILEVNCTQPSTSVRVPWFHPQTWHLC